MASTLLSALHVFVCMFLILVVLLQQGRGGGMGAMFGGSAAQQVFGGRGAGNILTRATAICATIFMLTSVGLAYLSSSGDRELRARAAAEAKTQKATPRAKDDAPKGDGAKADGTKTDGTKADGTQGNTPEGAGANGNTPPEGAAAPGTPPSGSAPAP